MIEEYRAVKGYEGIYEVSNFGNVKSLRRENINNKGTKRILKEKLLKPAIGANRYFHVCLILDKIIKTKSVHQLVAIAFLNHTPENCRYVVDHIDNNPLNNLVNNLQIITHRENLSKDIKIRSSKYIGVHWFERTKKWKSSIRINGKKKHLGYFLSETEAAKAYKFELNKL